MADGKESKGEITPLEEYLDRFDETKVRKVEKFVNRDGGGEVPNVTVRLVAVLVAPRET